MENKNKYPCSQEHAFLAIQLLWNLFIKNLLAFTNYKKKYTEEFAEAALGRLNEANEMPDHASRNSLSKEERIRLHQEATDVVNKHKQMEGYIEDAWKAERNLWESLKQQAGHTHLADAARDEWPAVVSLGTAGKKFLATHTDKLIDNDNMPETFVAEYDREVAEFMSLLSQFGLSKEGKETGAEEKVEAFNKCYQEVMDMSRDAVDRVFPDSELGRSFTFEQALRHVRSTHPAGVKGFIRDAQDRGVVNVTVTIAELGKSVVTDKDGRYALQVSAGKYVIEAVGTDIKPIVKEVVVEAGIRKRVNMVAERV